MPLGAGTSKLITFDRSKAISLYVVCLWVQTESGLMKGRPLFFKVCGLEKVSLTNKSAVNINYSIFDDHEYQIFKFSTILSRFKSSDSDCPAKDF
jgi:hypothetical protein